MANDFIFSKRGIFYVLSAFPFYIRPVWINFEEKKFESLIVL